MGQIGGPDSDEFRGVGTATDNEVATDPEILLVMVEQATYFANALNVKDKMYQFAKDVDEAARAQGTRLRYLVLDMSSSPYTDSTVMHMLSDAVDYFAGMGVRFCLAGPNTTTRTMLRKGKLVDKIGERYIFATLHQANLYCRQMMAQGKEEEFHIVVDDHH